MGFATDVISRGYVAAFNNLAIMYDNGEGVPSDPIEATRLLTFGAEQGHPMAMYNLALRYKLGKGGLTRNPDRAYELLAKENIFVRVVDAYSVKPIDAKGLLEAASQSCRRLLVVEEHYYDGGLGDAVLNGVANSGVQVCKLAVTEIPRSGKAEELLDRYGISARCIVQKIRELTRSA